MDPIFIDPIDLINKDLTKSIYNIYFSALSVKRVLLNFGWHSSMSDMSCGRTIINRYFTYEELQKLIGPDMSGPLAHNVDQYDCFIWISKEIRESKSRIFKAFTLSHEFQHIAQHEHSAKLYVFGILLRTYFSEIKKLDNQMYWKLPNEYDAITKSKSIVCQLFGENDVNSYIDSILSDPSESDSHEYWKFVKDVKRDDKYVWENESEKTQNANLSSIEAYLTCKKTVSAALKKDYDIFRTVINESNHDK